MLWGFGLKCDDTCGTPPPWRDDPSAWQWSALGWVGIGGVVCALVFLVGVGVGRKAVAAVACGAWSLVAGTFLVLFKDSGLTSHAERGWLGLAGVVTACVVAIALTPPRTRDVLRDYY